MKTSQQKSLMTFWSTCVHHSGGGLSIWVVVFSGGSRFSTPLFLCHRIRNNVNFVFDNKFYLYCQMSRKEKLKQKPCLKKIWRGFRHCHVMVLAMIWFSFFYKLIYEDSFLTIGEPIESVTTVLWLTNCEGPLDNLVVLGLWLGYLKSYLFPIEYKPNLQNCEKEIIPIEYIASTNIWIKTNSLNLSI